MAPVHWVSRSLVVIDLTDIVYVMEMVGRQGGWMAKNGMTSRVEFHLLLEFNCYALQLLPHHLSVVAAAKRTAGTNRRHSSNKKTAKPVPTQVQTVVCDCHWVPTMSIECVVSMFPANLGLLYPKQ